MSKVLVFGGHGKIAMLLAPLLVKQGDEVTAVIRNPDHSDEVAATGASPVVADVETLDVDALAELIAGHDAVVWSAGAGGGNPPRTYAVDRDAAIRSMDATAKAGVARYVMVSYFGAQLDHGVDPEHFFFPYAEAKAAADTHLRDAALDYTILCPSKLTLEEASGRIDTAASGPETVSRANVALAIQATLADDGTVRRTIPFNDGDTPVAEALRA